jgi:hypothetical protein
MVIRAMCAEFWGEARRKERPRRKWKDNIKMVLREIG